MDSGASSEYRLPSRSLACELGQLCTSLESLESLVGKKKKKQYLQYGIQFVSSRAHK